MVEELPPSTFAALTAPYSLITSIKSAAVAPRCPFLPRPSVTKNNTEPSSL